MWVWTATQMVEVAGLEPAASWSQTKHSQTKLSYTSEYAIGYRQNTNIFNKYPMALQFSQRGKLLNSLSVFSALHVY